MGLGNWIARHWKKLLATAVVLLVLWNAFLFLFPSLVPAWLTQQESANDIQDQVYDAENALQNYEWFKQQRQDIVVKRKQINTTQGTLDQFYELYGTDATNWSYQTKQRHQRLRDRLDGQRNMHDQLVGEYNARANQAHRAIFQCGLPYNMESKFWLGDGRPNDQYREYAPGAAPETASECTNIADLDQ